MSKTGIIAPEVLKTQTTPLSEEQEDAIRDQALARMQQKEKGEQEEEEIEDDKTPLPKKKDTEEIEDDKAGKKTETDEEREAREKREREDAEAAAEAEKQKEAEERQKKIDAAKAKPEEKLNDEEKALLKEVRESEEKARKESFEKEVEEYAIEHGMTEAQARRDVEKINVVREKYKNDPGQMSKALHHLTVKLTQVSQELAAIRTPSQQVKQIKLDGKLLSEEETKAWLVENYRKANPEITAELEDDKIHRLALKEIQEKTRLAQEKQGLALKDAAEKKRQELLESLPEKDKRFAKEVRGVLYRHDDSLVLSEDFDIMDLVFWARGRRYDKDVQEAYERGKAEAVKEKKILGSQPSGTSGGGQTPQKKSSETLTLNKEQKERALEMYDSLSVPDEKKFEMYASFLAKQNQIDKSKSNKE